jgi:hypothetical protein
VCCLHGGTLAAVILPKYTFNPNVERLRAHSDAVVLNDTRYIHICLYFAHSHFGYLSTVLDGHHRITIVDGMAICYPSQFMRHIHADTSQCERVATLNGYRLRHI